MSKFKWKYAFCFFKNILDERSARKLIAKHIYRILILGDNENIPKEIVIPERILSPFNYKVKKGKHIPYTYVNIIDEDGCTVRDPVYGIILDILEKLPNPNWPVKR